MTQINDLLTKLKPVIGEQRARKLWLAYQLEPSVRREIEIAVTALAAKHLNETYQSAHPLLEPPSQDASEGDYPLGQVVYADKERYPFGLREQELIQHAGVYGRSGAGKTCINFLFLQHFLENKKPFLVFDWKRNYRDLLDKFPDEDILVFTVGRDTAPFYFNPLTPPKGTDKTVWIKQMIEVLLHSHFLGEGVAYWLLKSMDRVYRKYDAPTLKDVQEDIDVLKPRGREALWHDSCRRAVGSLCYGEMGRVLNSPSPFSLEDLLKKNVILELDALTHTDKTFLIETLLLWIHHFRMQEPKREVFKHTIVVEEAHHIFLQRQDFSGKETIMDIIAREIRELGEALLLSDQIPHKTSKVVLANTYTLMALSLTDDKDMRAISENLLLAPHQKEYLGKLPVGWGIVKLQGRHFTPFLVKFDHFSINKASVTDEDVKAKMRGFYEQYGVEQNAPRLQEEICEKQGSAKETHPLTSEEETFLKDIVEHPFSGLVERYRRLSLNTYKGNFIRDVLTDKGIIQSRYVAFNKGRILILELTQKGREILGNPPQERRGGAQHEYYKEKIAEHFKNKGYVTITEYPIGGGKTVDVVAMNEAEKIAVEIETGKSDAAYNIQKCLPHFDKVISIVLDDKTKAELQAAFQNETKVQIIHVRDFFSAPTQGQVSTTLP